MYTQCPECLSVFSLDAYALARARGRLLCGHCDAVFDGLLTLTDKLPPEPFGELEPNVQTIAPVPVDLVVYRPQPEPPAIEDDLPESDTAPPPGDFSQLVFTPRFARTTTRKAPRSQRHRHRHLRQAGKHRGLWATACTILFLLLAAQAAWAGRDVLLTQPITGAWLRAGCAALHCTPPLVAAPRLLRVVDSNVQTHPSAAHALLISARVRNDASFAQPYPVLTLTLSDAQGRRIAMRRLQPREYLDDGAVLRRGLDPGASTVLVLEVADPGNDAVAFELGFE